MPQVRKSILDIIIYGNNKPNKAKECLLEEKFG